MAPTSQEYFASVAGQWDELRAGYFSECMRDRIIAKAKLPKGAIVADIGTGTGFFAAGLAKPAAIVYGFDASVEMIKVARRNLEVFPNVELRQCQGEGIPLPDQILDGVFANMYLHHTPDPQVAIEEMTRLLKPGGVLCITDLDTHNHEWQRKQMADLWLGFDRTEIQNWMADAGMVNIDVDSAEGTCKACGPDGKVEPLSIFVATAVKS